MGEYFSTVCSCWKGVSWFINSNETILVLDVISRHNIKSVCTRNTSDKSGRRKKYIFLFKYLSTHMCRLVYDLNNTNRIAFTARSEVAQASNGMPLSYAYKNNTCFFFPLGNTREKNTHKNFLWMCVTMRQL